MGLDRLNEIANERFEQLRQKQFGTSNIKEVLNIQQTLKKEGLQPEEFNKMQDSKNTATNKHEELVAEKQEDFIDKIDALGLSPDLSLAVSFIVIAHHEPDKKVQSIKRAVMTLEDEIN